MSGKRSHWLAIGLILTTGAASIALAVVSLAGFGNDTDASSSMSGANLVIVALGTLLLVALEYAHSMRRSGGRASFPASAQA